MGREAVKCSDQRFWHYISEGPDRVGAGAVAGSRAGLGLSIGCRRRYTGGQRGRAVIAVRGDDRIRPLVQAEEAVERGVGAPGAS